MKFPVLIYKEKGDFRLYGYNDERVFRHTSRELLQKGVLDNEIAIDSTGKEYKFNNIHEIGYANKFWGFSFIRKGRQILINFDVVETSEKSLQEVKELVLNRIDYLKGDGAYHEVFDKVSQAKSIEQIIKLFI